MITSHRKLAQAHDNRITPMNDQFNEPNVDHALRWTAGNS